ncbi:hypothetical protein ACJZ2D_012640 [Fusarium nematophilum]
MDPISAAGIAACAIQVVDFGTRVISTTTQIHSSATGASVDHSELEAATTDLVSICGKLEQSMHRESQQSNSNQTSFNDIGRECQKVALELLDLLNKVKGTGKHMKWRSFRLAVSAVLREDQIKVLEKRLGRFKEQLILGLLASLHEHAQAAYSDRNASEDNAEDAIGTKFLKHLKAAEKWQQELIKTLYDIFGKPGLDPEHKLSPPSSHKGQLVNRLLHNLSFEEIYDRHERISDAFARTFEWIYQPPKPGATWASFINWLKHEDGVYWITGKPGSGKSTLMKMIHDEKRTTDALDEWANGSRLITAGFYFWNSGEEVQMSLEGLIRTLLYFIATKCKEIVPDLFPDRWEVLNLFGQDDRRWMWEECVTTFKRLADTKFSRYRFFFLIDGLDEFGGDHTNLLQMLQAMVQSPHIKICVASRDWPVFQEAFSQKPNLLLQELTTQDIEIYVQSKFEQDPGFLSIKQKEPTFGDQLLSEVAQRSSGVFLWVRLVVQSLLHGICNGDRISDLRTRLDELPQDLESLFQKIFDSMEPRYQRHAAELFQIHRVHGSVSGLRFSFADEENDSIWRMPVTHKALTASQIIFQVNQMKKRVDSRTKGLLELDNWRSAIQSLSEAEVDLSEQFHLTSQCHVQYLHRTVKDFVESPVLWDSVIVGKTPGFDPQLSLTKALILEVITWDRRTSSAEYLDALICESLVWASRVSWESQQTAIELLDTLEHIVAQLRTKMENRAILPSLEMSPGIPLLLPLALQLNLHCFARKYHPYCPIAPAYFFKPAAMERIQRRDYFLLTVLLSIASRDSPNHILTHRYCWDHTQRLLLEILLAHPWAQTSRTVEGLLLLAEWLPHIQIAQTASVAPKNLFSEDRTAWSLVGLAVRQGYLLRLDRAAFRDAGDDKSKEREDHKRLVWAFVYIADRQISVRLGQSFWSRGPSLSSTFTSKDFPSLEPIPGVEKVDYASVLQATLELTQILYNAHLILYSSTRKTLNMISEGDYARYLDDFVRAASAWHTVWNDIQVPHAIKSTLLLIYGVYAAVFLHKAQSAGAFQSSTQREEVASLALRFVAAMKEAASPERHICHGYSRMLGNLWRQGPARQATWQCTPTPPTTAGQVASAGGRGVSDNGAHSANLA